MSTLIPNTSLTNLLSILKRNPLLALNRCRDRYQSSVKSHYEAIYDLIAFVVGFVLRLSESDQNVRGFLAIEYWSGKPQAPKEKNLSRLATMYVIGAKESKGALYDQALIYTKVVDYFLSVEIDPKDIPARLKGKGIYKLLDEISAEKEKSAEADESQGGGRAIGKEMGAGSGSISSDAEGDDLLDGEPLRLDDGCDNDGEQDDQDDEAQPKARRPGSAVGHSDSGESGPKDRSPRRFNPKEHVAIRGGAHLNRILSLRSEEELWIRVKRADDGGLNDWKDLVAIAVEPAEQVEGPCL